MATAVVSRQRLDSTKENEPTTAVAAVATAAVAAAATTAAKPQTPRKPQTPVTPEIFGPALFSDPDIIKKPKDEPAVSGGKSSDSTKQLIGKFR